MTLPPVAIVAVGVREDVLPVRDAEAVEHAVHILVQERRAATVVPQLQRAQRVQRYQAGELVVDAVGAVAAERVEDAARLRSPVALSFQKLRYRIC
jgi:hypothetical protein